MDRHGLISELLLSSPSPLTASEVKKKSAALPALEKLTLAKIRTVLEELASWGQLQSYHGAGKTVYYSAKSPLDYCADALEQLVQQGQPLQVTKLKVLLPKPVRAWAEEAVQRLVVAGKAHYSKSPSGQTLLQSTPPRSTDRLSKAQLASLAKVLEEINKSRTTPRTLDDLLVWLSCAEAPARPIFAHPTPELLRQWYAADTKRSSSSVMVPVLKTWDRYCMWAKERGLEPRPEELRKGIAELYEAGEAILEPADRPGSLSDLEKQLLVPLSIGPPGCAWGIL